MKKTIVALTSLTMACAMLTPAFAADAETPAPISHMLGRKESTVRSDLRRGRLKLKEILKEACDFEEIV